MTTSAERALRRMWPQFTTADDTRDGLLDVLPQMTRYYGGAAAALGADLYDDLRDEAGAPRSFRAVPVDDLPAEQAEALARWAVEPMYQAEPDPATALVKVIGGLQRLVANADRETIRQSVGFDPAHPRFARVTRGAACRFCRMLAGRGAVYHTEDRAGLGRKFHDHCHCIVVPAWPGDDIPPVLEGDEPPNSKSTAVEEPATSIEGLPRKRPLPDDADDVDRALELNRDAHSVNPRYKKEPQYDNNCVHVVNAMELRRRGYDVTASALPRALGVNGRNSDDALRRWRTPAGTRRHMEPVTATMVRKTAESWPVGARGWVRVGWKRDFGGGGHIFNVERTADGVRWSDGQNGVAILDLKDYMRRARPGRMWGIVRMDDMTPGPDVLEFVSQGGF